MQTRDESRQQNTGGYSASASATTQQASQGQSFALNGPTSGTYQAGTMVNISWTAGNVAPGSKISLCYDLDTKWNSNQQWIEIDGWRRPTAPTTYIWDTSGVAAGTYYIAGYLWDGGSTFTFSHLTQAIHITAPRSRLSP